MADASRDNNRNPTLLGTSSIDDSTPVKVWVDPVTHSFLMSATITGNVASGVTDSGNPVKVGGKYNASAPTFTDGQRGDLQIDVNGNLKTTLATLIAGEDVSNNRLNVYLIPRSTTVSSFQTTVTTAGTRVQLATHTSSSITIKAKSTNTGLIYVGDVTVASSNGFILSAGESISMDVNNTNLVYIDSSVNSEGISTVYIN